MAESILDRLARACHDVDSRHHFHETESGHPVCLCGFVGNARKRTQTEHITTEVIVAFKASEPGDSESGGAHPAATFTPEQVEAAARAIQGIERNAGNVAGIEWCRLRVQATFAAAGFQIEADDER